MYMLVSTETSAEPPASAQLAESTTRPAAPAALASVAPATNGNNTPSLRTGTTSDGNGASENAIDSTSRQRRWCHRCRIDCHNSPWHSQGRRQQPRW